MSRREPMDSLPTCPISSNLNINFYFILTNKDVIAAKRALDKYRDDDHTFESTRECTLLVAITEAYDQYDVDAYTNALAEFDNIQKFDNWMTTILLRIKKRMQDEDPSVI